MENWSGKKEGERRGGRDSFTHREFDIRLRASLDWREPAPDWASAELPRQSLSVESSVLVARAIFIWTHKTITNYLVFGNTDFEFDNIFSV